MRVSLNELESRYAKALEALGLPGGVAWDAGQMTLYHDLWGLDGTGRLAVRLDRLDGNGAPSPAVKTDATGLSVQAAGSSLLAIGPAALDLLEASAGDDAGLSEVRVLKCRDADLAAGLAGLAAARELPVSVEAKAGKTLVYAVTCGGAVAIHRHGSGSQDASAMGEVVLRMLSPPDCAAAMAGAALTADTLAARRADALESGVVVKAAAWRRVRALSARFLVEDTPESRLHGAGGGA